jgi:hypothetical protein
MGSVVARISTEERRRTMRTDLRFRLCPPFFGLRGMRIDTPASNNAETYEHDLALFRSAPQRRLMLRPAYFNEFDIEVGTIGQWMQLPQLHVLVTQLSIGSHLLTPLYRGKPFFGEVTTDSEVVMIVAEMAQRRGIDKNEFEQFEQAHNARIKATDSIKGEGEVTH